MTRRRSGENAGSLELGRNGRTAEDVRLVGYQSRAVHMFVRRSVEELGCM